MNAVTGKDLAGLEHLRQSIADILGTPIGTRVMRRDYGSRLPDLIDAPMTPELTVEIFAATAEALDRWEPRIKLSRVQVVNAVAGQLVIDLSGIYLPEGKLVIMEGIIIQ
ncbi:MAG: baseplate assembly protein W [Desulfobacteraceae bacterium]|nr:baseplate assembly protein W [Desulfobacteraceae bacterium]